MARKKQEIALQLEIETQEQWEELLAKEGLIGMATSLGNSYYLYSLRALDPSDSSYVA